MEEKAKSKPEHLLMEAIGFTEEDLEANREGYMTKYQRTRLNAKRSSWAILAFLAVGIGLIISIWTVIDGSRNWAWMTRTLGIVSSVAIVVAAFVTYLWLNWRRFDTDLRNGEIENVEGRVRLDVTNQGNLGTFYTLQVNSLNFRVTKPMFLAFKNGDPYCIYYAPHSKTMLSAEWLREG